MVRSRSLCRMLVVFGRWGSSTWPQAGVRKHLLSSRTLLHLLRGRSPTAWWWRTACLALLQKHKQTLAFPCHSNACVRACVCGRSPTTWWNVPAPLQPVAHRTWRALAPDFDVEAPGGVEAYERAREPLLFMSGARWSWSPGTVPLTLHALFHRPLRPRSHQSAGCCCACIRPCRRAPGGAPALRRAAAWRRLDARQRC